MDYLPHACVRSGVRLYMVAILKSSSEAGESRSLNEFMTYMIPYNGVVPAGKTGSQICESPGRSETFLLRNSKQGLSSAL